MHVHSGIRVRRLAADFRTCQSSPLTSVDHIQPFLAPCKNGKFTHHLDVSRARRETRVISRASHIFSDPCAEGCRVTVCCRGVLHAGEMGTRVGVVNCSSFGACKGGRGPTGPARRGERGRLRDSQDTLARPSVSSMRMRRNRTTS